MDGEQFKLIDTAIGLFFIFLIISILVTTTVELISSALRLRSVNLVQGLLWLFQEQPNQSPPKPSWRSAAAGWIISHSKAGINVTPVVGDESAATKPGSLTNQVLNHPLINILSVGKQVAPHIDPQIFSTVLVSILNKPENNNKPFQDINGAFANIDQLMQTIKDDKLRAALIPIVAHAQAAADEASGKVKAATDALAQWYDKSMAQASEWYKTHIRTLTLTVAALVVVSGNVDSIRIVSALWTDAGLRQAFIAQAKTATDNPQFMQRACPDLQGVDALTCQAAATQRAFTALNGVPIGWRPKDYVDRPLADAALKVVLHIPGWLLSIAAAMMGAPFWFDLLQKISPLRASKAADGGEK